QSLAAEQRESELQAQLEALRKTLSEQRRLNGDLRAEAEQARQAHGEFLGQLRLAEHQGRSEAELLRVQLEREAQARLASAIAPYQERLTTLQGELAAADAREAQLRQELERLRAHQHHGLERLAAMLVREIGRAHD